MITSVKPAMNLQDSFLNHVRKENPGVITIDERFPNPWLSKRF